jgi:hypothetical protein
MSIVHFYWSTALEYREAARLSFMTSSFWKRLSMPSTFALLARPLSP